MAAENTCLHNKFGHCRYRDTCRHRHIQEICENSTCEIHNCERRHPRECRFWKVYNRCKFGDFCSFKHKGLDCLKKPNEILEKELKIVKEKLDVVERLLCEKDHEISEILNKIETKKMIEADDITTRLEYLENKLDEIAVNMSAEILKQ